MHHQKLLLILEKMCQAAQAFDEERLETLNNRYEKLARIVYSEPMTKTDLLYDSCRTWLVRSIDGSKRLEDKYEKGRKELEELRKQAAR